MKKEVLRKYIWILMIVALLLPVVIASGYTTLCEDDFSFEAGARDALEIYGSRFTALTTKMQDFYNNYQGTYFFTFMIHILMPYVRWGLPGFHFVMIMSCLLFFAALGFLVHTITRNKELSLIIMAAMLLMMFGIDYRSIDYKEFFLWYTGALNYTLELMISFVTVSMLIMILRETDTKKRIVYIVISSVLAFCGSGGTLAISALQCAWMLIALGIGYKSLLKFKPSVIPFGFALLGAVINTLGPGNFVRADREITEGHSSFANAVKDTFFQYGTELKHLVHEPLFILILVALLAAGIWLKVKIFPDGISGKWMIAMIPVVFITRFLEAFPVVFGYHTPDFINGRTEASFLLTRQLMYAFLILCLAQWINEHVKVIRNVYIGLGAVSLLLLILSLGSLKENIRSSWDYNIARELKNGTIVRVYNAREYAISTMEQAAEDSDCIIVVEEDITNNSMYGMGVGADSGEFVNQSAAGLFKLHSATILYMSILNP